MIKLREGYWAVEVPEGATKFGFISDSLACKMPNSKPGRYKWLYHIDEQMTKIGGEWEIVCTSREATEEQAASIVEEVEGGYKGYDVNNDNTLYWRYADSSLKSLLVSKDCDLNKTYLILKKK